MLKFNLFQLVRLSLGNLIILLMAILVIVNNTTYAQSEENAVHKEFSNEPQRSVVAILRNDLSPGVEIPWGTGFLYYNYDKAPHLLVTNKHIFMPILANGKKDTLKTLRVKTNISDNVKKTFPKLSDRWLTFDLCLKSGDTLFWTAHPDTNIDIAVIYFPPVDSSHFLLNSLSDSKYIPMSLTLPFEKVEYGQKVIFLGFPLGLGANKNPQPVMRFGAVSFKDDINKTFLIDAQVFGGSSGSPIITTGYSELSNKSEYKIGLIGITSGFKWAPLRFGSMNSTGDTIPTRLDSIPIENTGLGVVYSVDLIEETIKEHNKLHSERIKKRMLQLGIRKE